VLASGGGRILAMWSGLEGDHASLRTAVLSEEGEVISRGIATLAFLASDEVSWNGSEYLALHQTSGEIWPTLRVTLIDANGDPIDATPIELEGIDRGSTPGFWWQRPASVVWTGTQWMVAWPQGDVVVLYFISPAGVATSGRTLALSPALPPTWWRRIDAAAIASDGTRILLVWKETQDELCYFPVCGNAVSFTRAIRLTAEGELSGEALELPILRSSSHFSMAGSGTEFVVAGATTAVAIEAGDPVLRVKATLALRGNADVAWDGREYVFAYRRHAWQWYLETSRFDGSLDPIQESRYLRTPPPDRNDVPSVAATSPLPALIASQEGDQETGGRAVVYREDEMAPLPRVPGPPLNVQTRRLPGGRYETTWDAPPIGVVDAYYFEERTPDGRLITAGYVSGGDRSRITDFADVRVRASNATGLSATRQRAARH